MVTIKRSKGISAVLLVILVLLVCIEGIANEAPVLEARIPNDGDPICLPVTIENRTYMFIVDTGTSNVVVDEELQQQFGAVRRSHVETASGDAQILALQPRLLNVNGVPFLPRKDVLVIDFASISRRLALGFDIKGILGIEFLERYLVEFSFDSKQMRLWPRTAGCKATHYLPLIRDPSGRCFVEGTIGGQEEQFLIDSAALGFGWLSHAAARTATAQGFADLVGHSSDQTAVGRVATQIVTANHFTIGPFTEENVVLRLGTRSRLGLYYLLQFDVALDFDRELLCLTPRTIRFEAPEDLRGIVLRGTHVSHVLANSPASAAGLEEDDELLLVDNTHPLELQNQVVWNQFQKAAGIIRVRFRRDGTIFETRVSRHNR